MKKKVLWIYTRIEMVSEIERIGSTAQCHSLATKVSWPHFTGFLFVGLNDKQSLCKQSGDKRGIACSHFKCFLFSFI